MKYMPASSIMIILQESYATQYICGSFGLLVLCTQTIRHFGRRLRRAFLHGEVVLHTRNSKASSSYSALLETLRSI